MILHCRGICYRRKNKLTPWVLNYCIVDIVKVHLNILIFYREMAQDLCTYADKCSAINHQTICPWLLEMTQAWLLVSLTLRNMQHLVSVISLIIEHAYFTTSAFVLLDVLAEILSSITWL